MQIAKLKAVVSTQKQISMAQRRSQVRRGSRFHRLPPQPPPQPPPQVPPQAPHPQVPPQAPPHDEDDDVDDDDSDKPATGGPGEWLACREEGGWIRFSRIKGKADAHCNCKGHDQKPKCKLDKTIVPGGLGLSLLWFAKGRGISQPEHRGLKKKFAGDKYYEERKCLKADLSIRAADGDVDARLLLQLEEDDHRLWGERATHCEGLTDHDLGSSQAVKSTGWTTLQSLCDRWSPKDIACQVIGFSCFLPSYSLRQTVLAFRVSYLGCT